MLARFLSNRTIFIKKFLGGPLYFSTVLLTSIYMEPFKCTTIIFALNTTNKSTINIVIFTYLKPSIKNRVKKLLLLCIKYCRKILDINICSGSLRFDKCEQRVHIFLLGNKEQKCFFGWDDITNIFQIICYKNLHVVVI